MNELRDCFYGNYKVVTKEDAMRSHPHVFTKMKLTIAAPNKVYTSQSSDLLSYIVVKGCVSGARFRSILHESLKSIVGSNVDIRHCLQIISVEEVNIMVCATEIDIIRRLEIGQEGD